MGLRNSINFGSSVKFLIGIRYEENFDEDLRRFKSNLESKNFIGVF